jgi:hypothetical protein
MRGRRERSERGGPSHSILDLGPPAGGVRNKADTVGSGLPDTNECHPPINLTQKWDHFRPRWDVSLCRHNLGKRSIERLRNCLARHQRDGAPGN